MNTETQKNALKTCKLTANRHERTENNNTETPNATNQDRKRSDDVVSMTCD